MTEWLRYLTATQGMGVRFPLSTQNNGDMAQLVSAGILYIQGCGFKSRYRHKKFYYYLIY